MLAVGVAGEPFTVLTLAAAAEPIATVAIAATAQPFAAVAVAAAAEPFAAVAVAAAAAKVLQRRPLPDNDPQVVVPGSHQRRKRKVGRVRGAVPRGPELPLVDGAQLGQHVLPECRQRAEAQSV